MKINFQRATEYDKILFYITKALTRITREPKIFLKLIGRFDIRRSNMPKAKSSTKTKNKETMTKEKNNQILREPSEIRYQEELDYLACSDKGARPSSWCLSPGMVRTFVSGSMPSDKLDHEISPKWFGDLSIVERAIVTPASDRGLLLIGDPQLERAGLRNSMQRPCRATRTYVVQGTAGTTEDQIKYSWNVAQVIAQGQSPDSLIPSPIMTAMQSGNYSRFEELTRCTSDVQDALISIMSEKYVSVPELRSDNIVFAQPGFNIIATANSRDRGVNELSSALKRRFNFVHIPVVTNKASEKQIILFRTGDLPPGITLTSELRPPCLIS